MKSHMLRSGAIAVVAAASLLAGMNVAVAVGDDQGTVDNSAATEAAISGPATPPIDVLNFSSNLEFVAAGFESRRWSDEQYSQIQFTGCWAGTGSPDGDVYSTDVKVWHVVDWSPDESQGSKHFTNCFAGSDKVSSGEWHNVPRGDTYFEIDKIGGQSSNPYLRLSAKKVYVDTAAAD
ncbi:hypothetical protein ACFC09_45850 [Streptomyces sp. NPDC056161]|uniref:hypothetical protein n=1 Tax=Streptomyces sp. NPDC056161 TaxID=3345732 RepID=UPI0035D9166A